MCVGVPKLKLRTGKKSKDRSGESLEMRLGPVGHAVIRLFWI